MIELKLKHILALHMDIIDELGGARDILNLDSLEGAVFSIHASFDGVDLYPTVHDKAAALCYNIINDHAFRDGNKRVGVTAMLQLLAINDIHIDCSEEELIDLGFAVAEHKMNRDDILSWVKEHEIELERIVDTSLAK